MAISADINKALADQLFAIYSHAEFVMMEKVAKRVNRGITEIGWNEIKLQDISQFRQEIQALVNDVEKLGKKKLSSTIIEAFKMGRRSASTDLGRPESFMEKLFIPGSLQRLILESNNLISQTSVQILRNVMDSYRNVQAEAASGVLVGVDTRKQAAQRALNKFADAGITGFVDKRGRNWELASYVEMVTRTVTAHAALQGHLDRQAEIGNDLVMVSSFGATCPVCAPYAGKVLSISGTDQNYSSFASAREVGLFHPNCRHTVTAYFPFIDEGEVKGHKHEVENNPEAYAMQQKQRYNERQIRRWKRRQLAAITPAEAQNAAAQIKAWDSKQRELLWLYKEKFGVELKRKRERERITGRVGKAGKETSPNWTNIQIQKQQAKKPAQRGRKGSVAGPVVQKVGKEKEATSFTDIETKYGFKITAGEHDFDSRLYKMLDETLAKIASVLPGDMKISDILNELTFTEYRGSSIQRGGAAYKIIDLDVNNYLKGERGLESLIENAKFKPKINEPEQNSISNNPLGSFIHEMGHLLHDELIKNKYEEVSSKTAKLYLDKFRKELLDQIGLTASKADSYKLSMELSRYATKDSGEFFAEAFKELVGSDKPRNLAKLFGVKLNKEVVEESLAFKPAKTIDEAIEFAKQYFDNVDLRGIKLSHFNKINEGVYNARKLFNKDFKVGWLDYIQGRKWGKANAVCSTYNGFISFKKSYLTSTNYDNGVKAFEVNKKRNLEKYLRIINLDDKFTDEAVKNEMKKKYEALLKVKRWSASYDFGKENSIIATSAHEYGHAIYNANQYAKDNWLNELKAARVYDKMEDGIVSEYAMTNERELFAEVTAIVALGQEAEIPESILTIYKKMLKEG